MNKILIVDDDNYRHQHYQIDLGGRNSLYHADGYNKAIEFLYDRRFDLIYMDHDLRDFATSDERTGLDIIKYFIDKYATTDQSYQPLFVLHSMYPAGVANMRSYLIKANYNNITIPFGKNIASHVNVTGNCIDKWDQLKVGLPSLKL